MQTSMLSAESEHLDHFLLHIRSTNIGITNSSGNFLVSIYFSFGLCVLPLDVKQVWNKVLPLTPFPNGVTIIAVICVDLPFTCKWNGYHKISSQMVSVDLLCMHRLFVCVWGGT